MKALIKKIKDSINAVDVLVNKELFREAAAELWRAVRSAIFYNLKNNNIPYSSTKEALGIIIQKKNDLSNDIIFMEIIGTLCEWDQYFEISKEQIEELKEKANNLISKLTKIQIGIKISDYYSVLEEEIKRHTEDVEYAKATHYAAAERNDRLYSILLFWGFLTTLLGLSSLLLSISLFIDFKYNWIGHIVTLLGACVTLWPLIKDYSGKAMNHRRFAEEYNTIYKRCKNWETDFPDNSNIAEAKKELLLLRSQVISVNSLSPKTVPKDYAIASRNIDTGSYSYNYQKIDQLNKNKDMKKEASIAEKQNQQSLICLLKAQRVVYSKAKRYGHVNLTIAVVSFVLYILYVSLGANSYFEYISTGASLLGALVIILVYVIQKNKMIIGAKIQEKFDNELFNIPQNKVLFSEYPSDEQIIKYASRYKRDDLRDWYSKSLITGHPHSIAVLRCQYINLIWDQKQRKSFVNLLYIILSITVVSFIVLCLFKGYTFCNIVQLLIIVSPFVIYLINNLLGQREMIKNKDSILSYIQNLFDKNKKEKYIPSESELRTIQDFIYNHRTQVKSSISDIWYRIKKKSTEIFVERTLKNIFN